MQGVTNKTRYSTKQSESCKRACVFFLRVHLFLSLGIYCVLTINKRPLFFRDFPNKMSLQALRVGFLPHDPNHVYVATDAVRSSSLKGFYVYS